MTTSILFIVVLSALVTYLWRGLGVLIAARIEPDGAVFQWLGCVAYALLAGLMARIMIFPVGLLEQTTLFDRGVALAVGFVVFFSMKRNFFAATLVSTVLFYCLLKWHA